MDVWAERDGGAAVGVIVLSQLHMLELSASAQGWICAICKALRACLPQLAVVMPAGAHANAPGAQEQLWMQLAAQV